MENQTRTIEEIRGTIRAARDSVWVIDDTLAKLAGGQSPSQELKGNIERNVGHLEIVVASQEIIDSNEDIADLHAAITAGQAKLAENIWG
jgi:hypothetical protein